MLPKENRLKKRKEFNSVFREGKSVSNRFLEIKIKEMEGKKIGFVAPIKRFKKATDRNYVKRKLRESFRDLLDEIPENTGIIVIAKKAIKGKSVKETREIMNDLLSGIKTKNR